MLRVFSLVGMAAQAESRRLKAKVEVTAVRIGFYVGAGLMGLAAFVMLHVLGWHAARHSFGPVTSALLVMVVDLVLAGILFLLAGRKSVSKAEMEAEAVRNVALTGAAQSAVAGLTTTGGPLLALAGILVAALWPKLRGGPRM